jgi:hypothetical protein
MIMNRAEAMSCGGFPLKNKSKKKYSKIYKAKKEIFFLIG